MSEMSRLDRFNARWQAIERREKNTLKELKSTITSYTNLFFAASLIKPAVFDTPNLVSRFLR
jgi:hypothetical protein